MNVRELVFDPSIAGAVRDLLNDLSEEQREVFFAHWNEVKTKHSQGEKPKNAIDNEHSLYGIRIMSRSFIYKVDFMVFFDFPLRLLGTTSLAM